MASLQLSSKPWLAPPASMPPARGRLLQRSCACGGSSGSGEKCEECQKKEIGLQRLSAAPARSNLAPPIVHDVLRSPGQPLDQATRAFMEPRFGHDFGRVRVHTDAKAAESARAVAANAYTVGSDIVFGAGHYAPKTDSGRALFAHELTHVVQQGSLPPNGTLIVGPTDDEFEHQAEGVAGNLDSHDAPPNSVSGAHPMTPVSLSGVRGSVVQRAGDPSANATPAPQGQTAAVNTGQSPAAAGGLNSGCDAPDNSAADPIDILFFANNVSTLNDAQRTQVGSFVKKWNGDGTRAPVRLDGYASPPGTEAYNLNLSCSRAQKVAAEMTSPTSKGADGASMPGIPNNLIRKVGQGETAMFGPDDQNRRVAISAVFNAPTGVPTPATVPLEFDDKDCSGSLASYTVDRAGAIQDWKLDQAAAKVVTALSKSSNVFINVSGYYPMGDTDFDPNQPIDAVKAALIKSIGPAKIDRLQERIVTYYGSGGPYPAGVGGKIEIEPRCSSIGPGAISPGPTPKADPNPVQPTLPAPTDSFESALLTFVQNPKAPDNDKPHLGVDLGSSTTASAPPGTSPVTYTVTIVCRNCNLIAGDNDATAATDIGHEPNFSILISPDPQNSQVYQAAVGLVNQHLRRHKKELLEFSLSAQANAARPSGSVSGGAQGQVELHLTARFSLTASSSISVGKHTADADPGTIRLGTEHGRDWSWSPLSIAALVHFD